MTWAWYGHLKLQNMKVIDNWSAVTLKPYSVGWYLKTVFKQGNTPRKQNNLIKGPFSLMQLKVIQEVITLVIFTDFSLLFF
jgi:uncharacterized protein (DUF486 family)